MNKFLSIILISFSLTACREATVSQDEYDSMVMEKDEKIAELESRISELQDHVTSLEEKANEVTNQFDRFESENWREVVPDADDAVEELNAEVENNPEYSY